MKTAVIYARYSSDNQTEQSIEGQLRVCEQYAKNNDILILHTYIDRAMTGTNDNRPDFQKMIKASSDKEFQYILVYKIDRFSRNKYEMAKYKKILKDNGVKLLSAMENIPDTPEGIILESLLEGMAEYYSAELSQKVKRGMRETRIKGYFQGGYLPYGYKLNERKIVIDEFSSNIVKLIFNQYANGLSTAEIVSNLKRQGITHRNKNFNTNLVYRMLSNKHYIGIYQKDNEIYENMYPAIISAELFEKVDKKRQENKYGKRSEKITYLFKDKLLCGYCGKSICGECGRSRNGSTFSYYKCLGIKKYHNGCIKETIRQNVLEEFLIDAIITQLSKPKILNVITENLLKLQENSNDMNNRLNLLNKQKEKCQSQLDNMLFAIQQGVINKTTNKKMIELENEIENLDKQILFEQIKSNDILNEKDIKKYYIEALKQEPLILVNYLIKQIKLYNDKVEITFNSPIQKSPENQGFSFLSIYKTLNYYMKNLLISKNLYLIFKI